MTKPIMTWLRDMGYEVWTEMPLGFGGFRMIDLVGIAPPIVIGVEMKRNLTCALFRQAYVTQLACDAAYCAIISKPKRDGIDRCEKIGLGILTVSGGRVTIVLDARMDYRANESVHEGIIENSRKYSPGGIAGLPTLRGEGPAIEVTKAVDAYRRDHPEATWKEIYAKVANHYSNVGSMMSSLSKCRQSLERRRNSG